MLIILYKIKINYSLGTLHLPSDRLHWIQAGSDIQGSHHVLMGHDIRHYINSAGTPDNCQHTANLSVLEYLQLVQYHVHKLCEVVIGDDHNDSTNATKRAMASALGYCSGQWIRYCSAVVGAPVVPSAVLPIVTPGMGEPLLFPDNRL